MSTPNIGVIGVIGVGQMGLGMALRLRDAGLAVTVHDLLPEREALAVAAGARRAAGPADLSRAAELVIVAVVDAAQTEEVIFGAQGLLSSAQGTPGRRAGEQGPTVMLCPTISPDDVESFAARLAQFGCACIDAPMSGGPLRARDGSMSLMVAAEDAVFNRWEPVLLQLASHLFHIGTRCGDGARTKLVNNLLAAANLAAACEAIALAERVGLDARQTLAVIAQSSGQSWIGSNRLMRALGDDQGPAQARMALLAKDSALALQMAGGCGAAADLGAQAAAQFATACAQGLADADDSRLLSLARQRARPATAPPPG